MSQLWSSNSFDALCRYSGPPDMQMLMKNSHGCLLQLHFHATLIPSDCVLTSVALSLRETPYYYLELGQETACLTHTHTYTPKVEMDLYSWLNVVRFVNMSSGAGNPLILHALCLSALSQPLLNSSLCKMMRSQCAFALSPRASALIGTEWKVVVLMAWGEGRPSSLSAALTSLLETSWNIGQVWSSDLSLSATLSLFFFFLKAGFVPPISQASICLSGVMPTLDFHAHLNSFLHVTILCSRL